MSNTERTKVHAHSQKSAAGSRGQSFDKKTMSKSTHTLSKKKKKKSGGKSGGNAHISAHIKDFLAGEKFKVICGFVLLAFTLFLLVSFCSFLGTHDADDGLYSPNMLAAFSKGGAAQNMLGIVGMYFSFLFIKSGFGIASFGFIFLFALCGIRMIIGRDVLPFWKTVIYTLAIILAVSAILSSPCVFNAKLAETWWQGGEVCQDVLALLATKVGKVGMLMIVLLYVIIVVVLLGGWTLVKNMSAARKEAAATKASDRHDNAVDEKSASQLQRLIEASQHKQPELEDKALPVATESAATEENLLQEEEKISAWERIKIWRAAKKEERAARKAAQAAALAQVEAKAQAENVTYNNATTSTTAVEDGNYESATSILEKENATFAVTEVTVLQPAEEKPADDILSNDDVAVAEAETEGAKTEEDVEEEDETIEKIADIATQEVSKVSTHTDESGFVVTTMDTSKPSAANDPLGNEPVSDDIFDITDTGEMTPEKLLAKYGPYDPHLDLAQYQLPGTDLLENYANAVRTPEQKAVEIAENKARIRQTLENYKIEIESISAVEGPTVTLYEIKPAPGVRIARIKGLTDDIAMSLSAKGIRIIAPIPGRGTVGIEVANANPQVVPMKACLEAPAFKDSGKMALPVAIGKTISDEVYVFDLAKMPHVLMAGATGQGKSVGLNAVLASLLYKKHPSELKFVLVDPKKVELTLYSKIERHYLAKLPDSEEAIITDTKKVVKTLNSLCNEMDMRYALLKDAQCRNIIEYNEKFKSRRLNPEKGHRFLPYIVLVFDEFADCIMTAGREVETPIARLAQLARAIGIHVIIATQRPSVNVITGLIKANFPARISFKVASKIDSRTILDEGGAENLIGRGDMLISANSEVVRIQCALIDTPEITRICDFIGEQRGYTTALYLPEVPDADGEEPAQTADDSEFDPAFAEAAREVVLKQQGSTSFLQRKLSIGFNRAGRIMDQLEREGIVGPSIGSKPRSVLIKDVMMLEDVLKSKNL